MISLDESLMRAANKQMTIVELARLTEPLKASGDIASALKLYQTWIDNNEDSSLLYVVLFNYSTLLTEVRDFENAAHALEKSIVLNSEFLPSRINLGRVYENLGKPKRAVALWSATIDKLAPISGDNIHQKSTAINQMARVLEFANQDTAVEVLLKQSLDIDRTQQEVIQHYLATRQRLCEWPLIEPWGRVTRDTLLMGISPLSMAIYSDDPMLQLALNAHYNTRDVGDPSPDELLPHWAAVENRDGALRIGYLSSDLREHAIGFLMAELFELHNRKNVEVFVYYCGSVPDDPMMRRIKNHVEHWVSVTGMDAAAAARRIADDGIQILVDVNGYTRDAKTKIVARRPAPVIVNWLGFPGSMGSPYHNYIIADEWIIPKDNEKFYSEKVLRLPCYQPNDRNRAVQEDTPTRADAGLPEDAMVYCCFNGTQKITRFTFDRWLTILERVPGSVLWLLSGTEAAHSTLRKYAEGKGIDGNRLIFAEKKQNAAHLARYPLADLFLDTAPYGAHTTASDALWMGIPVLTLSGRAFASRVCGSLVRAAGLPEMACSTPAEYIDRAVALGKDKTARLHYREKLAALRDTCDLFNTPKLVSHLEDLYKQIWKDYCDGKLPKPDLTNLDVYLETGFLHNPDVGELQTQRNYKGYWLQALSRRHKVRPIPNDTRMWTPEAQKKMEQS